MNNVLRIAIVDPDDVSRESLKNLILGMNTIWLEAECSRYEFFSDVIFLRPLKWTSKVGVIHKFNIHETKYFHDDIMTKNGFKNVKNFEYKFVSNPVRTIKIS